MRSNLFALVMVLFLCFPALAADFEVTVQTGGTAKIPASFDDAWTLEFDGEFDAVKLGRWTAKRYVYDGGQNTSIDLFEGGCIRLARGEIVFMSASTGDIRNPGGDKDHYARVGNYSGNHNLKIGFDRANKRCKVWVDGKLKGDYEIEIRKPDSIGTLSFPGFSGKIRLTRGSGGGAGNLDDVIDGNGTSGGTTGGTDGGTSAGSPGETSGGTSAGEGGSLTAENPGTKTFTAPDAGTLQVMAKLSTYGPAQLSVVISSGGKERTWLSWKRNGGTDATPLSVDGQARADSIFERKPGDSSPKETAVEAKLQKGDIVTLRLEGDFGDGTPLLKYQFRKD